MRTHIELTLLAAGIPYGALEQATLRQVSTWYGVLMAQRELEGSAQHGDTTRVAIG